MRHAVNGFDDGAHSDQVALALATVLRTCADFLDEQVREFREGQARLA
jgi:hypothetical protein